MSFPVSNSNNGNPVLSTNFQYSQQVAINSWMLTSALGTNLTISVKPEKIDLFINGLNDEDPTVRIQSATSLIIVINYLSSNSPSSILNRLVNPFINTLRDENPIVQRLALDALGRLSDSGSRISSDVKIRISEPLLLMCQNNNGPYLQRQAMKALLILLNSGLLPFTADIKERIVPLLIKTIEDEDPNFRADSVSALGTLTRNNAAPDLRVVVMELLINRLRDSNSIVRKKIVIALKSFAISNMSPKFKNEMITPLLERLGDEDLAVQGEALNALNLFATSSITPENKIKMVGPLLIVLDSGNEQIRTKATVVLKTLLAINIPANIKEQILASLI